MSGAYDTEAHALVDLLAAVESPAPRAGAWQSVLLAHLRDTLTGAGVPLGLFDERIARWLAGWEPATVQAVWDWVARAHQAGLAAGRAERRDA